MVFSLFKNKEKNKKDKGAVYFNVDVKDIVRETKDAISIVFDNPTGQIKYKPGQYITLILKIDGVEHRRSYSLSSSPDFESELAITVKKMDQGQVSKYLVDHLRVGDEIKIMAPTGNFTADFNSDTKQTYVFFAGGSGVTPLISLMKSALIREPESRLYLIYQNRDESSIIFYKMIDELVDKYPNRLQVIHILSKPSSNWQGGKGRLSPDQIKDIFKTLDINAGQASFFTCGPKGMMDTVESTLDELGVDAVKRHKESFVGSGSGNKTKSDLQNVSESTSGSQVTILLDNEKHEITVKQDEYILETALDADINMPFSCQSGICTSCRSKLISGEVNMEDPEGLSDEELESGYILTCVSHPVSKNITIEVG